MRVRRGKRGASPRGSLGADRHGRGEVDNPSDLKTPCPQTPKAPCSQTSGRPEAVLRPCRRCAERTFAAADPRAEPPRPAATISAPLPPAGSCAAAVWRVLEVRDEALTQRCKGVLVGETVGPEPDEAALVLLLGRGEDNTHTRRGYPSGGCVGRSTETSATRSAPSRRRTPPLRVAAYEIYVCSRLGSHFRLRCRRRDRRSRRRRRSRSIPPTRPLARTSHSQPGEKSQSRRLCHSSGPPYGVG